jgi:hypothetical protein
MNVADGEVYFEIWAYKYLPERTYRVDAEENETLWLNISLCQDIIDVDIAKPLKAIYMNNNLSMPFAKSVIIGDIDVVAYVHDYWSMPIEADKVDFYVDDDLKATVTSEPFTWTWDEKAFGKHTIKVIACDNEGNSASDEMTVWKIF